MTRIIGLALLALVSLVLDMSLSPHLQLGAVRPQFGLALVVVAGLRGDWRSAAVLGLVVGALQDVAVGRSLGLHVLAMALAGFVAAYLSLQVYHGTTGTRIAMGGLAALVQNLTMVVALWLFGHAVAWLGAASMALGSMVWTAVLVVLLARLEPFVASRPRMSDL